MNWVHSRDGELFDSPDRVSRPVQEVSDPGGDLTWPGRWGAFTVEAPSEMPKKLRRPTMDQSRLAVMVFVEALVGIALKRSRGRHWLLKVGSFPPHMARKWE